MEVNGLKYACQIFQTSTLVDASLDNDLADPDGKQFIV
jgi:hypothetical protein